MKKILFCFLMCCSAHILSAQEVKNDTVTSADLVTNIIEMMPDSTVHISTPYTELEPQLLADINWLNFTPLNDKRKDIRDEKTRFVFMWMSGSPTVTISVDDRIMKFTGAEPWALLAYMMGWTKYSVEHNYDNDAVKCTVAAITNTVEYYQRNKDYLPRSKELNKFAKMIEDNSLEKYVKTTLEL